MQNLYCWRYVYIHWKRPEEKLIPQKRVISGSNRPFSYSDNTAVFHDYRLIDSGLVSFQRQNIHKYQRKRKECTALTIPTLWNPTDLKWNTWIFYTKTRLTLRQWVCNHDQGTQRCYRNREKGLLGLQCTVSIRVDIVLKSGFLGYLWIFRWGRSANSRCKAYQV